MVGDIYIFLYIFFKVLDVILKIFEARMCYIGVVEGFLVLRVWFVGAVNTTLHIIDLILYIICWSLQEINVFSVGVTLGFLLINRRDKLCILTAFHDEQSYKLLQGLIPYCFQLESEVLKKIWWQRGKILGTEVGAPCTRWGLINFKYLSLQITNCSRPWILTQPFL